MVPNSSANFTRALQPRRLFTEGHAKLPEIKWRQMWKKSPLIRFVDELDFKQIPVSVKRKKKEEYPSRLIRIDSNCDLKRVESSSESSSGEEDELEGENNSDQDQTSSSCSESGEISKSGEAREKGKPSATTSVKKSSKKRKASKNILSEEEVEELCERLESKRLDLDYEIARKLESSPNLAFYPSRAALKEAILGDKNVLNEITDEFIDEFIGVIHDVYHTKMTKKQFWAIKMSRSYHYTIIVNCVIYVAIDLTFIKRWCHRDVSEENGSILQLGD